MPTLTTKELSYLNDLLSKEQVLARKCHTWSEQCMDPQLKTKCNMIADKHQNNFDTLMGYLS